MCDYLFTSESVLEGHPDKVCDYISDSILDEYIDKDKKAKVAIETMLMKDKVIVAGEVNSKEKLQIKEIVRNSLKEIGYDNSDVGIDYRNCEIETKITLQSEELRQNIEKGYASDQGFMFGFACSETEELMPFGLLYANKLAESLAKVRKENVLDYLEPDGKLQLTVKYEDDKPVSIKNILISAQHKKYVQMARMRKDIINNVIIPTIPSKYITKDTQILINPAGRFIIGGPIADVGLTGRKIVMDTYGGYARHGGGAFSGKDPSKIDRSGAYMLRYIAKNIVAKKIAKKCELQIGYSIGIEKPISMYVNTFGTSKMNEEKILNYIIKNYDLSPNGIIKKLDLQKPIYKQTTNYGHFGKKFLPWEKIED